MKDFYLDAEEQLTEELGREPTWDEIELRVIDLYSSAIDAAHDRMDMER